MKSSLKDGWKKSLKSKSLHRSEKVYHDVSSSPEKTFAIGREFAAKILPKEGAIVCFKGEIGAGKTTFIKGAFSYFGVPEDEVISPTFTYVHEHLSILHFDLYRLESFEEIKRMGFDEMIGCGGTCFIEWPEILLDHLENPYFLIELTYREENIREIILSKIENI